MTSKGASLSVTYSQTFIIRTAAFVEAFGAEWEDAQKRGLDEHAFALESIQIMGSDQLGDLADREDDDWDVVTL